MYWTEAAYANSAVHNDSTKSGETAFVAGNGYVTSTITGIYAFNMYDNYYVRAYNAAGELSEAYGASVASYLTKVVNAYAESTDAEQIALHALAQAMLVYGNNASNNPEISK